LYYKDEDLIDELWKIKYLENQTNFQETVNEMVMIIGKCNVSENAWSTLFDRIIFEDVEDTETQTLWKLGLLLQAVQSYAPHAPKVTEMILRQCWTENLIQVLCMCISVVKLPARWRRVRPRRSVWKPCAGSLAYAFVC
jgi:hypothetical protein